MGNAAPGPFPWKYFITGNISVKCSDLRNAGGFDMAIDRYGGEDTEMGYRLMKAGCSFYWTPSLSVNHLDNVTVRQHSMKMLEYGGTGLRYTLGKHPGTRGLLGSGWVSPLFSRPVHLLPARLLTRVALQRSLYRLVLGFAEKHRCPGAVYTYLSVGACLAGLGGKDLKL
jgi:GT2 family glycosyltransferase